LLANDSPTLGSEREPNSDPGVARPGPGPSIANLFLHHQRRLRLIDAIAGRRHLLPSLWFGMAPTVLHQQCAVHAFAALLSEYGDEGKAYSVAANPASPPWTTLDPTVHEGSTESTIATYKSFFPDAVIATDLRGKQYRAADRIYARGRDVKELILSGWKAEDLHRALSWHSWNHFVCHGCDVKHVREGHCVACEQFCPREYAALMPKMRTAGRPSKARKRKGRGGTITIVIPHTCNHDGSYLSQSVSQSLSTQIQYFPEIWLKSACDSACFQEAIQHPGPGQLLVHLQIHGPQHRRRPAAHQPIVLREPQPAARRRAHDLQQRTRQAQQQRARVRPHLGLMVQA
jgi:hypothetical protein